MSDVVPFRGQKVPEAFRKLDPNKSLGEGVQGGFPILNYRGKVWSLQYQGQKYPFKRDDDGTALTYLDLIILDSSDVLSKIYFAPGEWTEDATDGPLCASLRGDVPDPGVPEPQSDLCATCDNNKWTTLPNGGRGKLCQDHKRMAILLMPAMTKKLLGAPLLEPVYLKVPPGSLSALKAYGDMLRHESYPFPAVITRVSFSDEKLFRFVFEGKKVLTDKEAPLVLPLVDDVRTKRIIGEATQVRQVTAKAPPPPKEPEIDTGLEEAFGAPAPKETAKVMAKASNGSGAEPEVIPPKKARGRPPKAAGATEPPVEQKAKEAAVEFDEEDSALDDEVASLLDMKIDNMLK